MELLSESGRMPIDGANLGLHSIDKGGRLHISSPKSHEDEMTYFDHLYNRDRFRGVTPIIAEALTAHVSTQGVVTVPVNAFSNINVMYEAANKEPTWTTYTYDTGRIGRSSKRHSRMRNKIAKASKKRNRK